MRIALKIFAAALILLAVFVAAVIWAPIQRSARIAAAVETQPPPAGRGAYLAKLANCGACHTKNPAEPYAGGTPIGSPFGAVYATNITPSRAAGIGAYTLEDFRAALRDGLRPDGRLLYPAMPYENYRQMSDEDIAALYHYFMREVRPVDKKAPLNDLPFPFNQRWALRLWDWAALAGNGGFKPRYNNARLDRGAYIAEALAHCGACHTPRDRLGRQSGLDPSHPGFLAGSGGAMAATDLRSPASPVAGWSEEDMKLYLATGRNRFATATGSMLNDIKASLQYMEPQDLDAVAAYLERIKAKGAAPARTEAGQAAAATAAMLSAAKPDMPLGARLYLDNCAACHFVSGRGAAEVFPQLAGASIVNAANPSALIKVILGGARLPSTALRPEDLAMPGFGWRLNNAEVAALVGFLRTAWGNNAPPVTADEVARLRPKP